MDAFETAARTEAPPVCEHYWISHSQDSALIPWVIRCGSCGAFNTAEMDHLARDYLAAHDARVRRDAAREVSTLPERFRDLEALARFIVENEWALDSEIHPSGRADWLETLNRVHDNWDESTPEDIVNTVAAAIRLDRDFRTPFQEEVARDALTDLAESSLRTAEIAAARGDKEWERDARFVAREVIEHRNARYPEETP